MPIANFQFPVSILRLSQASIRSSRHTELGSHRRPKVTVHIHDRRRRTEVFA